MELTNTTHEARFSQVGINLAKILTEYNDIKLFRKVDSILRDFQSVLNTLDELKTIRSQSYFLKLAYFQFKEKITENNLINKYPPLTVKSHLLNVLTIVYRQKQSEIRKDLRYWKSFESEWIALSEQNIHFKNIAQKYTTSYTIVKKVLHDYNVKKWETSK